MVVGACAVLLALVLVALLYSRNYVKVPPNKVGVFTGRGRMKIVVGGARFRMPIIERYDEMSLEPYNVDVPITDVYSADNVPVNVTAAGLIKIGSTDEMIATAVERFLTTSREQIHQQVREILAGNMRSIVSRMTVEDLNSKRDEFRKNVLEEAVSDFGPIGMQLDVLVIQSISDNNGYLDALGQKRTAEVKRDAAVGTANADRETREKQAEASRLAEEAEAQAATLIAKAHSERDIEVAKYGADVSRQKATAEQAGPLAEAQARREVVVAEAAVQQDQERSAIAVEQQRALRAAEAQRADVIVPAEAKRDAAVVEADGVRQATIKAAEGQAEATRAAGNADADARKAAAEARTAELAAEASGDQAKLEAQAKGQTELAMALKEYTPEALQLQVMQLLIEQLPVMAEQFARQLGAIDRMVVVQNSGSGDDGGNMISQIIGNAPAGIAAVMEAMKATTGFDVSGMVSGNGSGSAAQSTSTQTLPYPVAPAATVSPEGASGDPSAI